MMQEAWKIVWMGQTSKGECSSISGSSGNFRSEEEALVWLHANIKETSTDDFTRFYKVEKFFIQQPNIQK